ncbi:hypothetical protein AAFN60_19350 [Roseibacillus persicicus]|uniref:hypothetical protein n=1 Tax=Roseibacillus persicicus TaxID=454148 RepID=UPI00398B6321
MKMTTLKSVAIAVGLCSSAFGQATSPVVGYETISVEPGFNFVGLRLHEKPVASGELETVTANEVVDNDVDLGSLMDGSTFVLEIENAEGVLQEVTMASGTGLATADTSGITAPVSYTLRPSANVSSVFGDSAGTIVLDAGTGSSVGADQVWLWNGSAFDKYYFDSSFLNPDFSTSETWVDAGTSLAVDGSSIDLVYADGIVLISAAGTDFTVSGDLKSTSTELALQSGFNFVSSVAPVGANLNVVFGDSSANVSLAQGGGSSVGADQVWVWNGSAFDKYYFDQSFLNPDFSTSESWVNAASSTTVDGSTIELPSGYVIVSAAGGNASSNVPVFYNGL